MNSDDDRQDPSEWKDRIATQVSGVDSYLEPLIGESKKSLAFESKDEDN